MFRRLTDRLIEAPARMLSSLQAPLPDLLLLGMRVYVAWQFFKAGLLKIGDWSSTLYLFENEYRVPLLSPALAALLGTFGELVFPPLVALGLVARLAALGLQAVNIVAVVAYAHVIFDPTLGIGASDHYLWAVMLLVIAIYGPGRLSVDKLLIRESARP